MIAVLLAAGAWSYITAAYVVVFGTLIAYAAWVIVRGRRIGRQLPPEDRRWSQ
ncbi:MAG: hypothetical protein KDB04_04000 [Acidimicrobiales bacterium]|nr:hypothetical protein [Acidimicrobiales bacterium]HRW37324.1 hypothetical protein [Aquihabitans sp.]